MNLRNLEALLVKIAVKRASHHEVKTYQRLNRNNDILLAIAWPPYRHAAERALRRNQTYVFGLG